MEKASRDDEIDVIPASPPPPLSSRMLNIYTQFQRKRLRLSNDLSSSTDKAQNNSTITRACQLPSADNSGDNLAGDDINNTECMPPLHWSSTDSSDLLAVSTSSYFNDVVIHDLSWEYDKSVINLDNIPTSVRKSETNETIEDTEKSNYFEASQNVQRKKVTFTLGGPNVPKKSVTAINRDLETTSSIAAILRSHSSSNLSQTTSKIQNIILLSSDDSEDDFVTATQNKIQNKKSSIGCQRKNFIKYSDDSSDSDFVKTPKESLSVKNKAVRESHTSNAVKKKMPKNTQANKLKPKQAGGLSSQPITVMFSGIKEDSYKMRFNQLGIRIVQQPMTFSTILIANTVLSSFKFLCAIAKGLRIVTEKWAADCIELNEIINPNGYLLVDEKCESKYKFKLSRSLKLARMMRLYSNYHIFVSPNTLCVHQLSDIITCSGGKCVLKSALKFPAFQSVDPKKMLAIFPNENRTFLTEFKSSFPNCTVVTLNGFYYSIIIQAIKFPKKEIL